MSSGRSARTFGFTRAAAADPSPLEAMASIRSIKARLHQDPGTCRKGSSSFSMRLVSSTASTYLPVAMRVLAWPSSPGSRKLVLTISFAVKVMFVALTPVTRTAEKPLPAGFTESAATRRPWVKTYSSTD